MRRQVSQQGERPDGPIVEWLLHPDRSYTPHELAMETVRRLRAAADSRPAELTELAAEIAKSWTPHRHDPKSCGDCLALVAADSRPAEPPAWRSAPMKDGIRYDAKGEPIRAAADSRPAEPPTVETLAEWLHDLDGTQHFVTHETGYDGDDEEGVECTTGVEGHMDDARDLAARLRSPEADQAETPDA